MPEHITAPTVVAVLLAATVAGCASPSGPSTAAPSAGPSVHRARDVPRDNVPLDAPGRLPRNARGALGLDDGEVPAGVTVLDDGYPAVSRLDPALLRALRRAARAAREDAVELDVNSGWRSRAYQEALLDEAVSTYGSRAEAARWVATPATSPHVSGDAVDIGGKDAAHWLDEHGARFGLCQIYRNEPWHYELRPGAVDDGCPPTYADPTQDPRMQQ